MLTALGVAKKYFRRYSRVQRKKACEIGLQTVLFLVNLRNSGKRSLRVHICVVRNCPLREYRKKVRLLSFKLTF